MACLPRHWLINEGGVSIRKPLDSSFLSYSNLVWSHMFLLFFFCLCEQNGPSLTEIHDMNKNTNYMAQCMNYVDCGAMLVQIKSGRLHSPDSGIALRMRKLLNLAKLHTQLPSHYTIISVWTVQYKLADKIQASCGFSCRKLLGKKIESTDLRNKDVMNWMSKPRQSVQRRITFYLCLFLFNVGFEDSLRPGESLTRPSMRA